MENKIMENMMLKFLILNYPISRIKIMKSKRFKRGLLLNDKIYYLSDSRNQINFTLSDILKKVFSCDEEVSLSVLRRFL